MVSKTFIPNKAFIALKHHTQHATNADSELEVTVTIVLICMYGKLFTQMSSPPHCTTL